MYVVACGPRCFNIMRAMLCDPSFSGEGICLCCARCLWMCLRVLNFDSSSRRLTWLLLLL